MMRLSELGERNLLKKIFKQILPPSPRVLVGAGDDAAVVNPRKGRHVVYTTDILVEKIDFDLKYASYRQIGHKAMAANLSDLAAMGAFPVYCLLTMGLPSQTPVAGVLDLLKGLNALGKKHRVALIGGDLSESPFVLIGLTVIGEIKPGKAVLRRGASPGDTLFVTGTLGDSRAGLEILKKKPGWPSKTAGLRFLLERHLTPSPRLREGQLLSGRNLATSMLDLSDGLATDLLNLTEASRVGADIFLNRIPLSLPLLKYCRNHEKDPVLLALSGGEDFELLFSVSSAKIKKIETLIRSGTLNARPIGKVSSRKGIRYLDQNGKEKKIPAEGYEHFKPRQGQE